MTQPAKSLSFFLLCLFSLGALAACSRGEGKSCQVSRDCDNGLLCDIASGSDRGVCRKQDDIEPPTQMDSGVGDAGALPNDGDASFPGDMDAGGGDDDSGSDGDSTDGGDEDAG